MAACPHPTSEHGCTFRPAELPLVLLGHHLISDMIADHLGFFVWRFVHEAPTCVAWPGCFLCRFQSLRLRLHFDRLAIDLDHVFQSVTPGESPCPTRSSFAFSSDPCPQEQSLCHPSGQLTHSAGFSKYWAFESRSDLSSWASSMVGLLLEWLATGHSSFSRCQDSLGGC